MKKHILAALIALSPVQSYAAIPQGTALTIPNLAAQIAAYLNFSMLQGSPSSAQISAGLGYTPVKPVDLLTVGAFCTGVDGPVTITGTTTLTRDMCFTDVTFGPSGRLHTSQWKFYATGTCDLSVAQAGAIRVGNPLPGNNASGATAGAGNGPINWGVSVGSGKNSGNGATGGTGAGAAGAAGAAATGFALMTGGDGASGGVGGASGTPNAGGSGSAGGVTASRQQLKAAMPILETVTTTNVSSVNRAAPPGGNSGAGGGAGGGDGTNQGGGGGAGGSGATNISLACAVIARGTNTTAGIIDDRGQAGGNGGNGVAGTAGGGAGGGGGGGGGVRLIAGAMTGSTIPNAIDVSGGTGGNGGNGVGAGKGGNGGPGGNSGSYEIIVLNPPSYTVSTINVAGAAGGTTATITGATGGAGGVLMGGL